jgi:hypothetical protein
MQRIGCPHLLGTEPVKLLILGKERAIRERTVKSSYRIKLVVCHQQVIPGIGNRLYMARGYIACRAYKGKIEWLIHTILR